MNIANFFYEEESGKIVTIAEDEFTKNWLLKLKFERLGLPLVKVVVEDTNLERCNIKIRKRKTEYTEEEFRSQLTFGNEGLCIEKLKLYEKKLLENNPKFWIVTFGIDKKALEYIIKKEGKVKFDLGYTYVNVLGQKRKIDSVSLFSLHLFDWYYINMRFIIGIESDYFPPTTEFSEKLLKSRRRKLNLGYINEVVRINFVNEKINENNKSKVLLVEYIVIKNEILYFFEINENIRTTQMYKLICRHLTFELSARNMLGIMIVLLYLIFFSMFFLDWINLARKKRRLNVDKHFCKFEISDISSVEFLHIFIRLMYDNG